MADNEPRKPNAQVIHGKIQSALKQLARIEKKEQELAKLVETNRPWLDAKAKEVEMHLSKVDADTARLYEKLQRGNISDKEMDILNQTFEYAKHIHALKLCFNAQYDRAERKATLEKAQPALNEKKGKVAEELARLNRWASEDPNYERIARALDSAE